MGKPKKIKDPWEGLDNEFRAAVEGGSEEEIRAKLADTALATQELLDLQDADLDLQAAREQATAANQVYADGLKMNKLKVKFMRRTLQSRGKL